MKVKILSTGNVEDFNESYARRLVDMGQAVPVKEQPKKAAIETAKKLPETAQNKKPGKGKKK